MNNDALDHLMGAYFNQDYYLSGETIEEVMQDYLDSKSPQTVNDLIKNCAEFLDHPEVERRFEELYRYDFKPDRWGLTAAEFLQIISAQANAALMTK
ncbi:contact-dependent growth inhibition system immunity protein [Pantoea sp. BAV 3049]|uniref:contact-dependent growth inhibition system immunity protein n=1 Tax=Pantoea sp. BAV 3049 TaxID=2654188 RepID=UPI00131E5CB5|nr:contact-dependent growth inhibition system immunity protein [Pantoea sp. BAV 3049]